MTTKTSSVPPDDVTRSEPRPKTPPPTALPLTADTDADIAAGRSPELDGERRLATQTEGIFRRFVDEMDSRRSRCTSGHPAERVVVSDTRHTSPSSASPTSSSLSPSTDVAAADTDDEDDDQMS